MSEMHDDRLGAAWRLLEDGDPEEALDAAVALATANPEDADAALCCAAALQEMGEPAGALPWARHALALCPDDDAPRLMLASLLYETCAFEEGLALVDEVLRGGSKDPLAHHLRGVLCDLLGRRAEADAGFRQAARLDPDSFPLPLAMDRAAFDRAVSQAVASLPEEFRAHVKSVPILVEDVPSRAILETLEDPAPDLLGLYVGTPLTMRSTQDLPASPDVIYLFQRNLERACVDEAELVEEIGVTLRHELGHHLGLDDDDLEEAGHA